MKKVLVVLLVAGMVLGAVGCQKTPESPIVIGKNNDILIEKANDYVGDESIIQKLDAPLIYESAFRSTDGSISVIVNATVTVPGAGSAAIIRVSSGNITQEQANMLMEALVHTPLYDPYATPSKNNIMQRIIIAQQQFTQGPTDGDLNMTYYDDKGNPLTWEEWM